MTARKVLVSPGFGAGFATWNGECGKALAEDEQLIALVEAGQHRGRVPYQGEPPKDIDADLWRKFMAHDCSQAFFDRACEVGRANGCKPDWHPYCGGVHELEVQTVQGRYRIDEYDGSESLTEESEEVWW